MNNARHQKLLTFLATTFFLCGCTADDVLVVTTGTTGGNGYSNLVLKSHFSKYIALVDAPGEADFRVTGLAVSDTNPPVIIVEGNADPIGTSAVFENNVFIYLADNVGQTALNPATTSDEITISTDGTKLLQSDDAGKLEIIDPATKTIQQIGSSLTFTTGWNGAQITDDGSLAVFISNADLANNNSAAVAQIYTLTTDGSNVIKQVTSFTSYIALDDNPFALSEDGSIIFFNNYNDLMADGSNADGNDEIFSMNSDGTTPKQITDTTIDGTIDEIKSDASGSTVAY